MPCEAAVNCMACAAVSLLAQRNCRTIPSNTRNDPQATGGWLCCSATWATSKGALSTTLTAGGTGNPSTVATTVLGAVSRTETVLLTPLVIYAKGSACAAALTPG